jgi:hypothetical protein
VSAFDNYGAENAIAAGLSTESNADGPGRWALRAAQKEIFAQSPVAGNAEVLLR